MSLRYNFVPLLDQEGGQGDGLKADRLQPCSTAQLVGVHDPVRVQAGNGPEPLIVVGITFRGRSVPPLYYFTETPVGGLIIQSLHK